MAQSAFVQAVDGWAERSPETLAFCNSSGEKITYAALKEASDTLAVSLAANPAIEPGVPIIVHGHKSPLMLVCFLACAKAGHPYAPTDVSFPVARVRSICEQIGGATVLDTTADGLDDAGLGPACAQLIGKDELTARAEKPVSADAVAALEGSQGEDTFYLIFTSGSSGTPKGVMVTATCLDNFMRFMAKQFGIIAERAREEDGANAVFFNRAPFSFDMSVTDLALGLTQGGTLFSLDTPAENNMAAMFEAFAEAGLTWWVSTPSAMDLCLADPAFDEKLLPRLRAVLLIGEVFKPQTARQIAERFPRVRMLNCYGPTESTDLVSWCWIEESMLAEDKPLPIGRAMDGVRLVVLDPETLQEVPTGERGELFIIGNTVAKGYYKLPEKTHEMFESCPSELIGPGERAYRTGDEVNWGDDGLLYFHGRLDMQVKLHGYRIELGDIEANLSAFDEVSSACVVPVTRDGSIAHLAAFVIVAPTCEKSGFALTKELKRRLKETVPSYMVPRAFKYVDEFPMGGTGKVDRRTLAQMASGRS